MCFCGCIQITFRWAGSLVIKGFNLHSISYSFELLLTCYGLDNQTISPVLTLETEYTARYPANELNKYIFYLIEVHSELFEIFLYIRFKFISYL